MILSLPLDHSWDNSSPVLDDQLHFGLREDRPVECPSCMHLFPSRFQFHPSSSPKVSLTALVFFFGFLIASLFVDLAIFPTSLLSAGSSPIILAAFLFLVATPTSAILSFCFGSFTVVSDLFAEATSSSSLP